MDLIQFPPLKVTSIINVGNSRMSSKTFNNGVACVSKLKKTKQKLKDLISTGPMSRGYWLRKVKSNVFKYSLLLKCRFCLSVTA